MRAKRFPVCSILLVSSLATPTVAQVTWTRAAALNGRFGAGLAYDSARDRLVLFGGQPIAGQTAGDTWESDGTGWTMAASGNGPVGRSHGVMAYDPLRSRVILFGGRSLVGGTTLLADTWEWDGIAWTQRFPVTSPSARDESAMTWDGTNGCLVLFGGHLGGSAISADLWQWDGVTWTQVPTSGGPSARSRHAIAHDAVRQRLVLFGGLDNNPQLLEFDDTWEWDGTAWSQLAPTTSPPRLKNHTMLFRATFGRVLLFGGTSFGLGAQNGSWEWDGANWTQLATSSPPPAREYHGMVWDPLRHRAVVFGGLTSPGSVIAGDTWTLDATNTWAATIPPATPLPRWEGSLAADTARGRLVLFGGTPGSGTYLADTWESNGALWVQRSPAASPSARARHATATDPVTGNVLLFGGRSSSSTPYADMWEWLGTTWAPITAPGPSNRHGHRMCANEQDRTILLFGGVDFHAFGDTWRFDAVTRTWTQLAPAHSPTPRSNFGLARDPHRNRVVLFGGYVAGPVDDTWEWDGADWLQRLPATRPPARWQPGMTYDRERDRIVLYGGIAFGSVNMLGDTWEWNGTNWTQRAPPQSPPIGQAPMMVWDPVRVRSVLLTGNETWEYGALFRAGWSEYGAGCPGSAGTPVLAPAPYSLPWLGGTFELRVDPVAAGQTAFVVLGTRVAWGTVLLPLPLAAYGMPGCVLLAGGYSVYLGAANGGGALVAVPLPNLAALVGATIDAQAFVTDPPANAAGLVASRGGTMHTGGR